LLDRHLVRTLGRVEPAASGSRIAGARVTLRPASASDLDLLTAWFGDPEFVRWWGGEPKTRDDVAADYLGRNSGNEIVFAFIVLHQSQPIGYIHAWSDEPNVGGIDIVLIPAAQNRGLGPDAVRTLAHYCRTALQWTEVTIDPAIDNHRAIRAFEKAGFSPHQIH
jgi:aminoglycoside 6'-N-acetyltransferase